MQKKIKLSEISKKEITKKRLEILSGIDTSKKTQKELSEILEFKTRQRTSFFLRKHKIPFKTSDKNTITKKRLQILEKAGMKKVLQMNIYEIADLLGFEGDHVYLYTKRFLRTYLGI